MKKFDNQTSSGKEKAIKLGRSVPSDAIALGFVTLEEITPANNLSILDLSNTIPENIIKNENDNDAIIVYADELGILTTEDGSNAFPSDDLTIGDIYINKRITDERVDPTNINPDAYVHYYYVSRFFISAPSSFGLGSLSDFVDPAKFSKLSMKVVNSDGTEYLDKNTGRKKYRFLLEPFRTQTNLNRDFKPHRIIVLLDADFPSDLRLIYDKVEADVNGAPRNQVLGYSETINAIPFYRHVPEEGFVLDPNYDAERHFTIKKISQKYSDLVTQDSVRQGYQIITPKKAIKDYRIFEAFNWRLIARSRLKLNLETIDFGEDIVSTTRVEQKTINAAVLYSSSNNDTANSVINPYVFYRLQESVFNLSNYTFANPSGSGDKATANYWKVDIDKVNDLSRYDILAWSPTSRITSDQASKIIKFREKGGTLVLDLSAISIGAPAIDVRLKRKATRVQVQNVQLAMDIEDQPNSPLLDAEKNGGWNITEEIFEKEFYSVLGSFYNEVVNQYKKYDPFDDNLSNVSFVKGGIDEQNLNNLGVLLQYASSGDALIAGNIIATAFPLLSYCNSVYRVDALEGILSPNYGATNVPNPTGKVQPSIVEGPMKLLYNASVYALYCKAKFNSTNELKETVYNFVTPWSSSWVMDPEALFDDEKNEYFTTVNVNSAVSKVARDLMSKADHAFHYYRANLRDFLPIDQERMLADIDPNTMDFYIEITNDDVKLVNAEPVDEDDFLAKEGIPSSYNLFKVTSPLSKVYAYTDRPSPKLVPPSTIGAYVLKDSIMQVSESSNLKNGLSVLNSFKSYPFNLKYSYSYSTEVDRPVKFKAIVQNTLKAKFNGILRVPKEVCVPNPDNGTLKKEVIPIEMDVANLKSAVDDYGVRATNIWSNLNCFLYSGDIDITNDPQVWTVAGDSNTYHEYVQYIQYSMNIFSGTNLILDGKYGNATATVVRNFQAFWNQRYIDGIVDSETKSYIASTWKLKKIFEPQVYERAIKTATNNIYLAGIVKYIEAAVGAVTVQDLPSRVAYKKLTFSGSTRGPDNAVDYFFFKIPEKIDRLRKITIVPPAADAWRNWEIFGFAFADYKIDSENILTPKWHPVTGKSAKTSAPTLEFSINANKARYWCIGIKGDKLNGKYGSVAEGFGFRAIKAEGDIIRYTPVELPDICEEIVVSKEVTVVADIVQTNADIVSVYNSPVRRSFTDTATALSRKTGYVSQIRYRYGGNLFVVNFDPYQYKVGQTLRLPDLDVTFGNPIAVGLSDAEIISVEANGVVQTDNPVSLTKNLSAEYYELETSAALYSDSVVSVSTQPLDSTDFRLRSVSGRKTPRGVNTVTVMDGVMLLCDDNGAPYGFIPSSQIEASISTETQANLAAKEVSLRYGSMEVNNNPLEVPGLIYGFYDLRAKEFLGNNLSFIDYINRGPSNIYIGVSAIDADGNMKNSNEFLGPKVSTTFKPVSVPMKTIVPIFSLKYTNASAIKIGQISPSLSKFDTWELPISNGSFTRSVVIPGKKKYTDWKAYYSGQTVMAVYSTVSDNLSVNSSVFGTGYYDVFDEHPVIVDQKTIRARRIPIAAWNHPTDYSSSIGGVIHPEIKVYTRLTVDSPWQSIAYSEIRDINCNSGIIEFRNRIVPSDENLIKINYVSINKDILIRQVNGIPLPINPFLNNGKAIGRPIYVYINPVQVYRQSQGVGIFEYEKIPTFTKLAPVDFTFNSGKFDPQSKVYDPLALPIAVINVTNNPYYVVPELTDTRTRGGGIKHVEKVYPLIETYPSLISHWDMYPPEGKAYPKGGYVIIRIPESVKEHFVDKQEVYDIIRSNLTAGVVFDLQDLDGNSWS